MAMPGGRVRRVLVVLAAAAAAVTLGAGPAAAHDEIVGTSPAGASTVDTAPDRVVLTFAEPAIALGTQVVVTAPDGSVVSRGDVLLEGSTVVQALAPVRPAGTYHVDWRVTSADGHPVAGTFTFTATNPTPATQTPPAATAPASGTTGVPVAGSVPTPSSSTAVVPPDTSVVDDTPAPASGTNTFVGILILVLVVLTLVVVRIGRAHSVRRLTAEHEAGADPSGRADSSGTAGGA